MAWVAVEQTRLLLPAEVAVVDDDVAVVVFAAAVGSAPNAMVER